MINLMGPGWQEHLLLTIALLGLFIAGLKTMAGGPDRRDDAGRPDTLLTLWHRYEEGDLTRPEFERAKRSLREGTWDNDRYLPDL